MIIFTLFYTLNHYNKCMSNNIIKKKTTAVNYFEDIISLLGHLYPLMKSDKTMLIFLFNHVKYTPSALTLKVRFTIVSLIEDESFPLLDRRTIVASLKRLDKLPFFHIGRGTNSGYHVTINKELVKGNILLHFRFKYYEDRYSRGNGAFMKKYKSIVIPKSNTTEEDIMQLTLKCGNILYEYIS